MCFRYGNMLGNHGHRAMRVLWRGILIVTEDDLVFLWSYPKEQHGTFTPVVERLIVELSLTVYTFMLLNVRHIRVAE